jgi:SAM-dependent methyltransferase
MSSPSPDSSGYFDHARREVFALLPEKCDRLLELGCSSGATLRALKKERSVLYSKGIELVPEAAERAAEFFDDVIVESIDTFDFEAHFPSKSAVSPDRSIDDEKFDVILALDVLEHLVDPWRVVRSISKLLAPRGVLVVTLPNLRHRSVVKDLVFRNEFNYVDAGILDRTHLRFFVRKTAIELCESGGLVVTRCTTNKKLKKWRRLFSVLTRGWSDDFYNPQFNLVATHRS